MAVAAQDARIGGADREASHGEPGRRGVGGGGRLDFARRQARLLDVLSEVVPGLFVGSYAAAESADRLRAAGITHVVAVGEAVPEAAAQLPTLHLPMSDEGMSDLWELVLMAGPLLEAARSGGGRVSVFCNQGVNRSPALVAGYLVASGVAPQRALELLSSARPIVNLHGRYLSLLTALRMRAAVICPLGGRGERAFSWRSR